MVQKEITLDDVTLGCASIIDYDRILGCPTLEPLGLEEVNDLRERIEKLKREYEEKAERYLELEREALKEEKEEIVRLHHLRYEMYDRSAKSIETLLEKLNNYYKQVQHREMDESDSL